MGLRPRSPAAVIRTHGIDQRGKPEQMTDETVPAIQFHQYDVYGRPESGCTLGGSTT